MYPYREPNRDPGAITPLKAWFILCAILTVLFSASAIISSLIR